MKTNYIIILLIATSLVVSIESQFFPGYRYAPLGYGGYPGLAAYSPVSFSPMGFYDAPAFVSPYGFYPPFRVGSGMRKPGDNSQQKDALNEVHNEGQQEDNHVHHFHGLAEGLAHHIADPQGHLNGSLPTSPNSGSGNVSPSVTPNFGGNLSHNQNDFSSAVSSYNNDQNEEEGTSKGDAQEEKGKKSPKSKRKSKQALNKTKSNKTNLRK